MQSYDRWFKPQQWDVQYSGVAPDCRWAWNGLLLGWPIWGPLKFCTDIQCADPIRQFHGLGANSAAREMVSDPRGPALVGLFTGLAAFGLIMSSAVSPYLPLTECTLVFHKRRRTGNSGLVACSDIGLQSGSTTAQTLGCHAPYSDGVVYWDFGGFTNGVTRVTASGLTFGDNVFVMSTGPRGMEIWQDGVLAGSNAATPTRSASTHAWGIGEKQGGTPDNANYGCVLLYERQLSPGAIRLLSEDPWTPFRPARRVRYGASLPAGAGARAFAPALIG